MKKLLIWLFLFLFITSNVYAGGIDSNTALILHCDGTDGSTTFTDASTSNNKGSATVNSAVEVDTAQSKWGGGSALFGGDDDSLQFADDADFEFLLNGTSNVTIDFWVKHNTHNTRDVYIAQFNADPASLYHIYWDTESTTELRVYSQIAGEGSFNCKGELETGINDDAWHHLAAIKVGDELGYYLDGNQFEYSTTATFGTIASIFEIGSSPGISAGAQAFDGWMDEIRYQNSNYFSAAPASDFSDTITVPTEAYSAASTTNAQIIMIN